MIHEAIGIATRDRTTLLGVLGIPETFQTQIHFLDLLNKPTDLGRAEWVRSASDPGFVYCLVDGDELIVFECKGGEKGDQLIAPSEELSGAVSHYCNTTYLWLRGLANWDLLLLLLHSAKIDEKRFIQCRRIAHGAPVRVLESKLKIDDAKIR